MGRKRKDELIIKQTPVPEKIIKQKHIIEFFKLLITLQTGPLIVFKDNPLHKMQNAINKVSEWLKLKN
jgi:hypothetical protein